MKRKFATVIAALFLLVGIVGCGDNRIINERALVLLIGIGPAPHHEMQVFFQIPTPEGLTSLGSGAGNGKSSGKSFETLTGHGKTIAQAFAMAQARSTQDIYLGQIQAIILSTKLPPSTFQSVVSSLTRIGTLDKTAYVLATPKPVAQVLNTPTSEVPLPGLYISSLFGCTHCQTVYLSRRIWSAEKRGITPGTDLWLPVVTPNGDNFRVSQAVIYRRNGPALLLTPKQTILFGYLISRTSKGWINFQWHGRTVGIRGLHGKASMHPYWQGNRLHISVRIHLTGFLEDFPLNQATAPAITFLQNTTSKIVAQQESQFLSVIERKQLDPFNLGSAYLWLHPHDYRRWIKAYDQASWQVTVTTRLKELGDAI